MEAIMSAMNVIGPILLIAVLIWAWSRNRRARPGSEARADAGSKRLYEQIESEDERRG
jgi:hypothetical protein